MALNDIQDVALSLLESHMEALDNGYLNQNSDSIEYTLMADAIYSEIMNCNDLYDLDAIIVFTDSVVLRCKAVSEDNKFDYCGTFFEMLHDTAVVIYSELTESCEVFETYGWEQYV